MMIKNLFFPLVFLLINLFFLEEGYGQTQKLTPVMPLAPEAAEFSKYGSVPVSLVSGTPSISLPIYEINSGGIKIPISLSYNASGVQVNQRSTWVGLGWSLNSGGVISRAVRGKADEEVDGYFQTTYTADQIMALPSTDIDLLGRFADNSLDAHPDMFSYSLPSGTAGRFIYSKDLGKFQSIPDERIEITRITPDNVYTIRDIDGKKYFFTAKQTMSSDNNTTGLKTNIQSWYLTKILSVDGRDSISFTYNTVASGGVDNDEFTRTQYHSYKMEEGGGGMWVDQGTTTSTSSYFISYMVPDEILFRNGKVKFYAGTGRKDYAGRMLDSIVVFNKNDVGYSRVEKYSLDHDYFVSDPNKTFKDFYRLRLKAFKKENINNSSDQQIHSFEYNTTTLPEYNSNSQDYWGYYNGTAFNDLLPNTVPMASELGVYQNNGSLIGSGNRSGSPEHVKAGILEKIVYPTKGYTVFNFESNRYKSDVSKISIYTVTYLSNFGIGKNKLSTATNTFTWPQNAYTNNVNFSIEFSAHTNPSAADVAQKVWIKDLTDGSQWVFEHTGDFTKKLVTDYGMMLTADHQYEIRSIIDDVAATSIKITVTSKRRYSESIINYGAGIRIRDILNYDNSGALLNKDTYTYSSNAGGIDNGMITRNDQSLSDNYYKSTEVDYLCYTSPCTCNPLVSRYITYVGSATYSTFDFSGAKIVYNQVTKTSYDAAGVPNGKIVSYFDTNPGYYPSSIYNPTLPGGREYFDNSLFKASQPIYEGIYRYNPNTSDFALVKEKSYEYGGINNRSDRIANVWRTKSFPHGKCPFDAYAEKLDYYISMGTFKLSAIEETNYDGPSPLTVRTEMSYNPLNLLVNQEKRQNSDGKTSKTLNKYSVDYQDSSYGSDLLRSNFMNDVLIEKSSYSNDQLISKDVTSYANFNGVIKPSLVQKLSTSSQLLENRIRFNNYDYYGNLLNLNNEGGIKVCYLWSYNNQLPIAEIKNADYNTVEQALGGAAAVKAFSNRSVPSKSEIETFLLPLRNNSTIQVHTYIHNPMVGISSQTDAKGQTTYYEYDEFQRLKNVKDQNGNIIKNNIYHYKP
ncbi:hypothetical protein [Pedobacter nutrimenti]|uniref:hypothetical protein n=1 Tax=Pedobacter nutrimenti TaxID=1241337 RepID=UPI00292E96A2|nr:hypothetical protein [Pedobacter nutrimenti]